MLIQNILFAPEWVMLIGCLLLFLISLGESKNRTARLAAILVTGLTLITCTVTITNNGMLFFGAYQVDLYSQVFKCALTAGLFLIVLISGELKEIKPSLRAEYYLFLMLSGLGLMVLVSATEWITLIVALELSSFPLYILVAMRRERPEQKSQMESAVKYIMFGVAANGIMFFGLSYLYGLTGTTYIAESIGKLTLLAGHPVAIVGIIMIMGGFLYKLAVFPFHFWTPDVYQGAANETTAAIATLPKLGAVAILIRLSVLASTQGEAIMPWLVMIAAGSMFYGNLIALVQTDIKRLLGFSGIAHAGYVLLGLTALNVTGSTASVYYIIGYVFMIAAAFLVICTVSLQGENVQIKDLAGLHKRAPFLAATLAIALFSLAGLPPFVGFIGKFNLLKEAFNAGHVFLVIIAVMNTAIAIYYYISIIKVAYIDSTVEELVEEIIKTSMGTKMVGTALCLIIIALGIMPSQIITLIQIAIQPMFG